MLPGRTKCGNCMIKAFEAYADRRKEEVWWPMWGAQYAYEWDPSPENDRRWSETEREYGLVIETINREREVLARMLGRAVWVVDHTD